MAGTLGVLRYKYDHAVDNKNVSIFTHNSITMAYT